LHALFVNEDATTDFNPTADEAPHLAPGPRGIPWILRFDFRRSPVPALRGQHIPPDGGTIHRPWPESKPCVDPGWGGI